MTNGTDYMFPPFRGELRRVGLLTGFKIKLYQMINKCDLFKSAV